MHKKLAKDFGGVLNYVAFEQFMRDYQKVRRFNSLLIPKDINNPHIVYSTRYRAETHVRKVRFCTVNQIQRH